MPTRAVCLIGLVHEQFAASDVVQPIGHLKRLLAPLAVVDFQAATMGVQRQVGPGFRVTLPAQQRNLRYPVLRQIEYPAFRRVDVLGDDVLNISQPNVNDIVEVGRRLKGRQCFMMPISYQTVSITGTPAEIHAESQRLYDLLGAPAGGFIGYVEEYAVMGMSTENYCACGEAFRRLRNP